MSGQVTGLSGMSVSVPNITDKAVVLITPNMTVTPFIQNKTNGFNIYWGSGANATASVTFNYYVVTP
jgi:hypothetical protein